MVWWLALSPHSKRVPDLNPCWGLSVWSLDVLPVHAWVLSLVSFHCPKTCMLSYLGFSIEEVSVRVHDCLLCLSLCGPVID